MNISIEQKTMVIEAISAELSEIESAISVLRSDSFFKIILMNGNAKDDNDIDKRFVYFEEPKVVGRPNTFRDTLIDAYKGRHALLMQQLDDEYKSLKNELSL